MHQGEFHFARNNHFKLKYTELNEIYIFETLRSLAFSFVVIFIPIYFYNLGFSIQKMLFYYISFYLTEAVVEPFASKFIRHFGPKHSIAFSVPFTLIHFWMLKTIPQYNWALYLVALTGALGVGFFWQAYHYDFSKAKRKGKATADVSRQYVMLNFFAAFVPFIGGTLAAGYGESLVFSIVLTMLLVGTLVLFKTSDKHQKTSKLNFKKLDPKCLTRDLISYVGFTWETTAAAVVWPLFVFLIVKNYQSVGLVTSVSIFVSVIIMHKVGKKSDDVVGTRQKFIRIGSISKGIIFFGQTFVNTIAGVYTANIFRAIANSISMTPWISEYYLHADEESRKEYLFVMELGSDIGRVLMFAILLLVSYFASLGGVLVAGIILGGIGAFMAAMMPPAKCELPTSNKEIRVNRRPAPRKVGV